MASLEQIGTGLHFMTQLKFNNKGKTIKLKNISYETLYGNVGIGG